MSYYDPYEHKSSNEVNEGDYHRMAGNYASWTRFANWTHEQRVNAAKNFGPNWASVLSGCGDQ